MHRVTVLPTRDGKLIVRNDHDLVLYSPEFKELANFPLDSRSHYIRGLGYIVQAVPGQDLVAVQKWFDKDKKVEVTWLDADTLTPRLIKVFQQKWGDQQGDSLFTLNASRDTVLQILYYPPSPPGLYVLNPDRPPRKIFPTADSVDFTAEFVSDHNILASTLNEFFVLSDRGQILFSEKLPEHEYTYAWDGVAGLAESGNRLAVPVLKTEGVENEMLHLSTHVVLKRVMVYDFPGMRLADVLDGKHLGLKHVSAIALSPHGRRLAILRKGAVELYRLPR